jgi:hypothetical protein
VHGLGWASPCTLALFSLTLMRVQMPSHARERPGEIF